MSRNRWFLFFSRSGIWEDKMKALKQYHHWTIYVERDCEPSYLHGWVSKHLGLSTYPERCCHEKKTPQLYKSMELKANYQTPGDFASWDSITTRNLGHSIQTQLIVFQRLLETDESWPSSNPGIHFNSFFFYFAPLQRIWMTNSTHCRSGYV